MHKDTREKAKGERVARRRRKKRGKGKREKGREKRRDYCIVEGREVDASQVADSSGIQDHHRRCGARLP